MATEESSNQHMPQHEQAKLRRRAAQYVAQILQGCGSRTCKNLMCFTGRNNITRGPIRKHTPRSARAVALCLLYSPGQDSALCYRRDPPESFEILRDDEFPKDQHNLLQHLAAAPEIRSLTGFDLLDGIDVPPAEARLLMLSTSLRKKLAAVREPLFTSDGALNPSFVRGNQAIEILLDSLALLTSRQSLDAVGLLVDHHTVRTMGYMAWMLLARGNHEPLQRPPAEPFELSAKLYRLTDSLQHHVLRELATDIFKTIGCRTLLDDIMGRLFKPLSEDRSFLETITSRIVTHFKRRDIPRWAWALLELFALTTLYSCWDGQPIFRRGTPACAILELRGQLEIDGVQSSHRMIVTITIKADDSPMGMLNVVRSYIAHQSVRLTESFHLLHFRSPFSQNHELLRVAFRTLNLFTMRTSQGGAKIAQAVTAEMLVNNDHNNYVVPEDLQSVAVSIYEQFLVLRLRRSHVLEDAFDQLAKRKPMELRRPLRVALREHDGIAMGQDLGGVQVEFFNMVFTTILKEESGMFTTNTESGLSYLRQGSLQPLRLFEYVGMLIALALYNGVAVPVSFPIAFYQQLLGLQCSNCADICDYWYNESQSLNQILEEPVDEMDLDYAFSFEANGMRVTFSKGGPEGDRDIADEPVDVFAVPTDVKDQSSPSACQNQAGNDDPEETISWNGMLIRRGSPAHTRSVTEDNKAAYVLDYLRFLTHWSVQPQLNALVIGFRRVLELHSTSFLPSDAMKKILEGSVKVDVDDLRKHTMYEGYVDDDPYIEHFWAMLESWSMERRRSLIRFVTAADRLPASGAAMLTFKIYQTRVDPQNVRLPTSSTCFGTLFLPRYESTTMMEDMLNKALVLGEQGFGNR